MFLSLTVVKATVFTAITIISVFQPHRYSRVNNLKKEFASSFILSDLVLLCPIYSAGEKSKLGFSYLNFSKEIMKNSKTKVYLVNDQYELGKFIKQNAYGKKIFIGMGAGSISNWIKQLPKLL